MAPAGRVRSVSRILATTTSAWNDDVRFVDSTPVECGRSRETVEHSHLAGWAEYGCCASRRRFFRGLRLHLVCTLQGLPIAFALTGAKANEREPPRPPGPPKAGFCERATDRLSSP